jgi:hypothetical protein
MMDIKNLIFIHQNENDFLLFQIIKR